LEAAIRALMLEPRPEIKIAVLIFFKL